MRTSVLIGLCLLMAVPGFAAGLTQISVFDTSSRASYLASTMPIDFSSFVDGNGYNAITQGGLTMTFKFLACSDASLSGSPYPSDCNPLNLYVDTGTVVKYYAPDYWNWDMAPYSAWTGTGTVETAWPVWNWWQIDFNQPLQTFGFELAPDYSIPGTVNATFLTQTSSDNFSQLVPSGAASRVVAATGGGITSVMIALNDPSIPYAPCAEDFGSCPSYWNVDYMLGEFRYSLDESVPEPGTFCLIGGGMAVGALFARRRRRA